MKINPLPPQALQHQSLLPPAKAAREQLENSGDSAESNFGKLVVSFAQQRKPDNSAPSE